MRWSPRLRFETETDALPATSVTVLKTLPVLVSVNVTVPLGEPAPGEAAVTVAVKMTVCPTTDGLPEETKPVLVLA